jgi:uracil-DNA glycosylase
MFDSGCVRCPRLARHLAHVRRDHPDYFAAPVPAFGDRRARLLIIGLAPGLHGANRTGRPFTGDFAGILLYDTLHRYGLASRDESVSRRDGLQLQGARITNAVKCLPPQNRPTTMEVNRCNPYLAAEISSLSGGSVLLALGAVAHRAVLRACGLQLSRYPFAHGAEHALPGELTLLDSYHCSRYNTQTGRLTASMFRSVIRKAANRISQ